jgi:hypothetical protein
MKHIILFAVVVSTIGSHVVAQSPSPGAPAGGPAPDLPGTTFGLPLLGGGVNGRLSISAGQGFSRSMTTNAALVTVQNGVPGFVFGGSIQPFVTGQVPVVAAGSPDVPMVLSPVRRMLLRGDIQVQKTGDGGSRLIVSDTAKPRISADPHSVKVDPPSATPNGFRRGIEKYAGSKR